MKAKIAIIGNGGLSRELQAYFSEFDLDYSIYVSDEYHHDSIDNNVFKLSTLDTDENAVIIAISDPSVKQSIVESLPDDTEYISFIHPESVVYSDVGPGTIVGPKAVITTDVVIGKHCLINCGVTVGHDTVLGDYCTVNPNAAVSGNCSLGNNVFVGANASIREKINVTNNTVIGMGAVVVHDITVPHGTYVGVPAIKLEERRTIPFGFITTEVSKNSPYAPAGDPSFKINPVTL